MQKQIKILLTILMALALAVSCAKNNPNNPTEDLNTPPDNEWVNNANFTKLQQKWQYDNYNGGYDIKADRVDDWTGTAVNYSIAIKEIVWNADNTSGIIYGQYTKAPSYNEGAINKFYAIAFQNLTETTIEIAGAYKSGGVSETDTLEQAKTTFTVDNGYFYYSKLNVVQ
ncbi:hypothetical protein R4K92_11905 [Brachyspira intermedia]|uniref:hypothetical protein n=1 Tax=Brachyspira intermedia TaxID=84377 RepID=UPI003004590D